MKNAINAPTPIGQRLKYEMKKRGVSSAELAKRADVKTSFIYDVISGKSANPSTVKLARVVDSLGISLSYLVDAQDNSRTSRNAIEDYITVPHLTVEAASPTSHVSAALRENEPFLFRRHWINTHLKATPENMRLLTVRGDSMAPLLHANDLVLVDIEQKLPSPPGIFVLFESFGLAVKRLEYVSGNNTQRIKMISDNPQYTSYERSADDVNIVGRVVWFSRGI